MLKQSREQGAGLSRVEREVTVSAFCRRRLAILMVRSGMVENVKAVCFSLTPWDGWDGSAPRRGPGFFFLFFLLLPLNMRWYFCAHANGSTG